MSQTRARWLAPPTASLRRGLDERDTAPVQALLRQRWRSHPSCTGAADLAACMPALARLEIVTPVSLRRDPQLTLIASSDPIALR